MIGIKSRNLPIFQYTFEAKYSIFIYISNIEGLMALWFGFTVKDIYIIIKALLRISKDYLLKHLITEYFLNELIRISNFKLIFYLFGKVKNIIEKIDQYNWKLLINILSILCLIYQVQNIKKDYLKFSINTDIKIKDFSDSDPNIDVKSLPAITI